MQDSLHIPRHEFTWMLKWRWALAMAKARTPVIMTGSHGMYYRYHDWFWNVGSYRAGNSNDQKK